MNIILYHANCADGFAAAFAAWLKFGDDAQYIPVSYQQPVPEAVARPSRPCEELPAADTIGSGSPPPESNDKAGTALLRSIYILDFSYPAAVLEELAARADVECVVVLDHHKTAQAALAGLQGSSDDNRLHVFFDMTKSGAVLAWEYFHPDKPVPEMLLYVQDRDLWQWKLGSSREINAALWRGWQRDFAVWEKILKTWGIIGMPPTTLVMSGGALLQSDSYMLSLLAAGAEHVQGPGCHPLESHGYPCRVVNSPVLQSELGEKILLDDPLCEYVDIWWDYQGERHHSLRSRPGGVDVSAIAKAHGGGGHQAAAGYKEEVKAQISKPQSPEDPRVCINCGAPAQMSGIHPEAGFVRVCLSCARGQGITQQRTLSPGAP